MSLTNWLTGSSPKPAVKRKLPESEFSPNAKRTFSKVVSQNSFDWYQQDASGKWRVGYVCNASMVSASTLGPEVHGLRPQSFWMLEENQKYYKPFAISNCAYCGDLFKQEGPGFWGGNGRRGEYVGFYEDLSHPGYCSVFCERV